MQSQMLQGLEAMTVFTQAMADAGKESLQSLTNGLEILEKVHSQMLAKLFLIACFTILPTCISAQEVWSKGDKVAAFFPPSVKKRKI